jgi:hypothetical protein
MSNQLYSFNFLNPINQKLEILYLNEPYEPQLINIFGFYEPKLFKHIIDYLNETNNLDLMNEENITTITQHIYDILLKFIKNEEDSYISNMNELFDTNSNTKEALLTDNLKFIEGPKVQYDTILSPKRNSEIKLDKKDRVVNIFDRIFEKIKDMEE